MRCKRYREEKKQIEEQQKKELQTLEGENDSLRKLQEDLARGLEMTRDYYLKCIISGKISFTSG